MNPNEYFTSDSKQYATIYVGPERKAWRLPEKLLCDHSEFFKNALEDGVKVEDGINKEVCLPDDDPNLFGQTIDWIFGKKAALNIHSITDLCKLYLLANKLKVESLAAESLKDFENRTELLRCGVYRDQDLLLPETIANIYNNTKNDDPIRCLMVEITAHYFLDPMKQDMEFYAKVTNCNPEFNLEVCQAIKQHCRIVIKDDDPEAWGVSKDGFTSRKACALYMFGEKGCEVHGQVLKDYYGDEENSEGSDLSESDSESE